MTPELKDEINQVLNNWARWCSGGWPPLDCAQLPTSRDYLPVDQRDKPGWRNSPDAVSAETATFALANLALHGHEREYTVIVTWWARHWPAKRIAKKLRCSLSSVYQYREDAMLLFSMEYKIELAKNARKQKNVLHAAEK